VPAEEHSASAPPILTIGHSTHPIEEFIEILRAHGIERLIDIRTIPRSRRNPQFNGEALAQALEGEGIGYAYLKELGGLRHARKDSQNTGWRNASFRGYADYMQTAEFEEALRKLLKLSAEKRSAVMCAEAVPWRCHRSLVGDALVARGVVVEHILGKARRDAHSPTPFAQIRDGKVIYPEPKGGARRKAALEGQAELNFGGTGFEERGPAMARKKRKPTFTAAKEARRRARLAAGSPPSARVIPDKRRKPPKHKKALDEPAESSE
jgi:hypothetical protein